MATSKRNSRDSMIPLVTHVLGKAPVSTPLDTMATTAAQSLSLPSRAKSKALLTATFPCSALPPVTSPRMVTGSLMSPLVRYSLMALWNLFPDSAGSMVGLGYDLVAFGLAARAAKADCLLPELGEVLPPPLGVCLELDLPAGLLTVDQPSLSTWGCCLCFLASPCPMAGRPPPPPPPLEPPPLFPLCALASSLATSLCISSRVLAFSTLRRETHPFCFISFRSRSMNLILEPVCLSDMILSTSSQHASSWSLEAGFELALLCAACCSSLYPTVSKSLEKHSIFSSSSSPSRVGSIFSITFWLMRSIK
mmetsp:Transcript_454/g.819  ORF Transcript_454/g.819 Transcript_454/m.819 type:complete len:308 (-) Transcript_454:777-1700(-)